MGRRKETHYHRCYDCLRAKLIKYTGDPIIAECEINHERQVASTLLDCEPFRPRIGEPQIEHRKKRIGISDKFI